MFCYVETAFHHQGDYEYMLNLIHAASESSADGIKFQILLDAHSFFSSFHPSYDELISYVFSREHWLEFFSLARSLDLKIIAMPCDYEAFKLCQLRHDCFDFLEIHSVNLQDNVAMKLAALSSLPIMLGIGGRYDVEIEQYVQYFGSSLHSLIVGIQSFPTDPNDVCFERISYLSSKYPQLLIGYADHTSKSDNLAIALCSYAYALGARTFELHVGLPGSKHHIDSQSAHPQSLLSDIFNSLRVLDGMATDNDMIRSRALNKAEINYRSREKKIVLSRSMKKWQILNSDDICLKMSGLTVGFGDPKEVVGKRLSKDLPADSVLTSEDFLS